MGQKKRKESFERVRANKGRKEEETLGGGRDGVPANRSTRI